MGKFLDRLTGQNSEGAGQAGGLAPSIQSRKLAAKSRENPLLRQPDFVRAGGVPNASIVYGVAAAVMVVIGLYFLLFLHKLVPGLLILVLACVLFGYAMFFIRVHNQ